jgi:SAM-dependent methyltransferase
MPELANVEQAAQWDGPMGESWVEREENLNASLAAHTEVLLAAADVRTDDRVLDVGCGTGDATRACARSALDGRAVGVDLSAAMLARARERGHELGLANVEFVQADAQVHPFPPSGFDLIVSRFGVMFFADPIAAFANLVRASAPAARLAAVVWQSVTHNEWIAMPRAALALGRTLPPVPEDVPGPFGLADPVRMQAILEAAGWHDVGIDDVAVPFFFGAEAQTASAFASEIGTLRSAYEELDDDGVTRAREALHDALAERASDDGVALESRMWVVTAVR